MVPRSYIVLGLGLLALASAAIVIESNRHWLEWSVGILGVLSLALAVLNYRIQTTLVRLGGLAMLSILLVTTWFIALLQGRVSPWFTWAVFGFVFCYFMAALSVAERRDYEWVGEHPESVRTKGSDSERPRNIA